MKLPGVHWVPLALASLLAGPSVTEPATPVPDGSTDAIGIVWHDQATVAPTIQQRLVSDLAVRAEVEPEVVVVDASSLVLARVALEIPIERAEKAAGWRSLLDDAGAAYRAGELETAQEVLAGLLELVTADPVVPGAARLAWRAQVLRGQLAWAHGDTEQLDAALAAAVALDPEAKPSTRQVPPPVVEAYERQRSSIVAEAGRWPSLQVSHPDGEPFALEIDGVPGRRPVPPGEHLVVVRRPGHAPLGAVVDTATPWVLPEDESVLEPGLPTTSDAAQRICQSAELQWLLLARQRGDRLGLQRYSCGQGFGPVWYEQFEGVAPGLSHVLTSPESGWDAAPVLHLDDPWPVLEAPPPPTPVWMVDNASTPTPRMRLRRALPWLLIGGVVAGAVTIGVVVAGEAGGDLSVDGDSFLRPRVAPITWR